MYLLKQEFSDIPLEVSFLCTVVIYPDTDYYKNLAQVIYYIQGMVGLTFIMSIDKSVNIKWYFDAEFDMHKEMRIHTCCIITMGIERSYVQSIKQKLNTKSSTEAEIVGVDYVLTKVIWIRYFLKEQGYEIHDIVIFQDNQIFIKLKKWYTIK